MAHYGQILDESYDPSKDNIYDLFVKYFGDLTMTKIKDVQDYSMYVAKIRCMLSIEHRYVIIFVNNDKLPLGNTDQLRNFRWINLQTRSLPDNHSVNPQTYRPRRMPELMDKIHLESKSPKSYIYHSEKYPIVITLLAKKSGEMEYQPLGTIVSALETFNTIISLR